MNSTTAVITEMSTSRIYIAYLLSGLLAVALGVSLYVSYLLDPNIDVRTPTITNEEKRPKDFLANRSGLTDGSFLAFLIGLHCLIYIVVLMCFSRYMPIYAVLRGMTKDEGIVLVSRFYMTFTLARFVAIYPSSRMSPKTFLIIVDSLFFVTIIGFFRYGSQSQQALNLSSIAMGAAIGPVYAAGTSYMVSCLVKLNHGHTSILKFMSHAGGLVPPLAIGPLIENHPEVFPEVILASMIMLVVVAGFVVTKDRWLRAERVVNFVWRTPPLDDRQPLLLKAM